MKKVSDELGKRVKAWESATCSQRFFSGQPIVLRFDGNAFHTFCKGLKKPYDERLSKCMIETMNDLMGFFHGKLGYTQSDEISVFLYTDSEKAEYPFNGKVQKLQSLGAARATATFNRLIRENIPEKANTTPIFDCRAFSPPTLDNVYETFYWRQQDAIKNAVSMAAHAKFSHKGLQGKHSGEMIQLLMTNGIDFNEYPEFFRSGTFAKRLSKEVTLSDEQLLAIPEKFRDNAKTCIRTVVENFDIRLPRLNTNPEFSHINFMLQK